MTHRLQDRIIHTEHGTGTAWVRGTVYDDPPNRDHPKPYCLVQFDDGLIERFRGWRETAELLDLPPEFDMTAIERFAHDNQTTIQEIQERRP